jgi:hypothetical protein
MAKKISDREKACLNSERQFLHDDMDRCVYCSESYTDFSRCWHKAAETSGTRSKECFV